MFFAERISSKASGSSATNVGTSSPTKTWSVLPPTGPVVKIFPFTRNYDFSKCGCSVVSGSDRANRRVVSNSITCTD